MVLGWSRIFSDFVLIFPPTIFEIGQAVPEICISKAPLLVRKDLLGWKLKNGISFRKFQFDIRNRQAKADKKFFNSTLPQKSAGPK